MILQQGTRNLMIHQPVGLLPLFGLAGDTFANCEPLAVMYIAGLLAAVMN